MSTREQFGDYLLLKKLFEDSLGETFRAGKAGKQGLEQVLLLKVFNGRDLDHAKLWAKISDRRAVYDALKSPNLGNGVDLGRVRGIPYATYDYISGKSLLALMNQAEREGSAIPIDLALFIADRVALGLAVGYETRYQDDRLLHGFAVPSLVMLSNEGEIRVLGFEAAPGLRASITTTAMASDITPYLSPETLAGQPVAKTDDVYSLGALLFELLTGKRPAGGGAALGQIDAAQLAADAAPIPADIVTLLKRSVGPVAQRVPDVVSWHKALAKIMTDRQYQPTTFNLAFFMHTLFRDEIERESKEIEVERTSTIALQQLPKAGGPAPGPAPKAAPAPPPTFSTFGGTSEAPAKTGGGNKQGLILGAGALAALLVAGGLYFAFGRSSKPAATEPVPTPTEAPASPAPAVDPNAAAGAAGPSPEEIRAQIDKMFAERAASMEKNLKAEYDQRIVELQKALADAQRSPPPERAAATPPQPAAERPTTPAPAPSSAPTTPEPAPAATESAPSSPAAETQAPPTQVAAVDPTPAPTPAPSAPRAPSVRVGDLVQPGPGVTPPKLKGRIEPRYPAAAKNLNKTATVVVRALVDENGRVERGEVDGTRAGYGFDEAALAAAKAARFDPATKNSVRVKMWTTLRITFQP